MSGWIHKYRLLLQVPKPILSGPTGTSPEIENQSFLSLQTSQLLHGACNANFSEQVSTTAFERDLQQYIETHGRNQGRAMQDRLLHLGIDPSTFLAHIWNILHLPEINPSIKIPTGMQPFWFTWVKIMIYMGPVPTHPQHESDNEEGQ